MKTLLRLYEDSAQQRTSTHEMYTSNYMIGRIALNVILMESNGDDENWTTEQEDLTIGEIVQGTDFLIQKAAKKDVNVSWVYEIHKGVPTSYEPIQNEHVPHYVYFPDPHWEFKWINHALSHLGYARDKWDGCFDMANNTRKTYYADWGYSAFVVMDENDIEDSTNMYMFTDGYWAYVSAYYTFNPIPPFSEYKNSCFVVMTYNNGGKGPLNMDKVFRHETCHIFRAPDEYYVAGYGGCKADDCTNNYGYLWVPNGNCERCNPNPVECIMYSSGYDVLCDYTLGHIGWRDTDGDGPVDPIDPNNGGWMSIPNLQIGDLIKIWTIDEPPEFVNLISVTDNNLFMENGTPGVIWNGHNFDGQTAVVGQYIVTVNDGEPFTRFLNPGDPQAELPYFSDISYSNGKLSWKLNRSWANVRCFIYDQSDELICRPVWDKAYANGNVDTNRLDNVPSGETYTAEFYAWRHDGAASQVTEFEFYQGCRGLCGDANADGTVNVSDVNYIINYVFLGGPPPQPVLACGDANSDEAVNNSDAVWITNYIFIGGAPPGDCSLGAFPEDCCAYTE